MSNYTPTLDDPWSNPTLRFLESRKVTRLKFLCLTHPHADHYRGMSHLLERFDPECVWLFTAATPRELYSKLANLLKVNAASNDYVGDETEDVDELVRIFNWVRANFKNAERMPRLVVKRLELEMPLLELNTDPPLRITAIGASGGRATLYEDTLQACFNAKLNSLAEIQPKVNHNIISGGLLIEYGQARVILGGDIETDAWEENLRFLSPKERMHSQLVKVSHHGSTTGYCDRLWEQLSPHKTAIAVLTPFFAERLPSPEGLAYISKHARQTMTTSVEAVELVAHLKKAGVNTAFKGVSAEAMVTLRTLFPRATPSSERLEGRCSFWITEDGNVTHALEGKAGVVARS